jgi:hypothetical protein
MRLQAQRLKGSLIPTRLYLVRHGQVADGHTHLYHGNNDIGLSPGLLSAEFFEVMCYTIAEALTMPSEQKIKQNLRAVENAIAQQRLEGLEVPPDIIAEMQRAARGEIKIEEGIRHTIRKFAHGKI